MTTVIVGPDSRCRFLRFIFVTSALDSSFSVCVFAGSLLSVRSLSTSSMCCRVADMDTIRELGVNPNAPSSESLPILTSLYIPQLLSI